MRVFEHLWRGTSCSGRRSPPPPALRNRRELTYDAAIATTRCTRRRAGLFASGDLVTAMVQTINELDLAVARPIRGEHFLRELCNNPDIADLFDLATVPEFAEARWATI